MYRSARIFVRTSISILDIRAVQDLGHFWLSLEPLLYLESKREFVLYTGYILCLILNLDLKLTQGWFTRAGGLLHTMTRTVSQSEPCSEKKSQWECLIKNFRLQSGKELVISRLARTPKIEVLPIGHL